MKQPGSCPLPGSDPVLSSAVDDFFETIYSGDLPAFRRYLRGQPKLARSVNDMGHSPLIAVVFRQHSRVTDIIDLLISKGANIESTTDDGWTPLKEAIFQLHDEAVKILLDAGANIHAPDRTGRTPYHLAQSFYARFCEGLDDHLLARMDDNQQSVHRRALKIYQLVQAHLEE